MTKSRAQQRENRKKRNQDPDRKIGKSRLLRNERRRDKQDDFENRRLQIAAEEQQVYFLK
jgi:hypothetical protein